MKQPTTPHRALLRTTQIAIASAAFALLAACGGGGGSSGSNTPPSGVNMQVVSFGTSLSDAGTYHPILLGFGGGRFTTNPGEVWTMKVSEYFGSQMTPAFEGGFGTPLTASGGLNYAQGGAQVSVGGTINSASATQMPIVWQIQQYLSQHGNFNANQIVLVDGGANEVLNLVTNATSVGTFLNGLMGNATFQVAFATYQAAPTSANQAALVQAVAGYIIANPSSDPLVGNIAAAAQTLATQIQNQILAKGATHVVVMDVPDVGQTPAGLKVAQAVVAANPSVSVAQVSSIITLVAAAYNGMLQQQLAPQIGANQVLWIDSLTWMDGILQNPSASGFSVTNTNTACNLPQMAANATAYAQSNPATVLGLPSGTPQATIDAYAAVYGAQFASSLFCSQQTLNAPNAPTTYMFADLVHPTTALHAQFAQLVETRLAAIGVGKAPQ
ncbi:MAG TPA: acylhydrolase [Paraburkholderia sp.]|jgi:phospholipase/lecithinase/hemolysin|nr:acylhydrolase [Paraburkholderia sp.]